MSIVHDSSTDLKQLKILYNGNTITRDIYTSSTNRWINVQVLARSNQIMEVYAWYIESFTLEPTASFEFHTLAAFTNGTITIKAGTTSPLEGVYFAEMKVFTLDLVNSLGILYRYYNIISEVPSTMIEYFRVTEGSIVQNAHNDTVISVPHSGVIEMPITFCSKYLKHSATTGECQECSVAG